MGDNLQSIVSQVREKHESAVAAREKKVAEERAEKQRKSEDGVKFLKQHVVPLLEKAKAALEAEGLPAEIIDEFENERALRQRRSVLLRCSGPERKTSSGGTVLPKSRPAIFQSDGTTMTWGMGDRFEAGNASSPSSPVPVERVEAAVAEATKRVAESYFESIDRFRSRLQWD